MKVIDKSDLNEVKQETLRVMQECKKKLEELIEEKEELNLPENELETDEFLIDSVGQMQQFYEMVKIKECSVTTATNTTDLEEFILVLQTILVHYDENNQYGNSLKQILPVGNYCWLKSVSIDILKEILVEQKFKLKRNKKTRVVDFYACVDMHLPDDCASTDRQREEEFNLLVRNMVPNVFHYTEKMLRSKRSAYAEQPGRYKALSLYKKFMSGTAPLKRYWIHSLIVNLALTNGWKITRIHNALTFTGQALTEDYSGSSN